MTEDTARWPIAHRGVEERIIPSDKPGMIPTPTSAAARSIEERAAELAAQHEDVPFAQLNSRQQYAYIHSVQNQDALKAKKAAEDAAEARLVDIERRLKGVEEALVEFGEATAEGFENTNKSIAIIVKAVRGK